MRKLIFGVLLAAASGQAHATYYFEASGSGPTTVTHRGTQTFSYSAWIDVRIVGYCQGSSPAGHIIASCTANLVGNKFSVSNTNPVDFFSFQFLIDNVPGENPADGFLKTGTGTGGYIRTINPRLGEVDQFTFTLSQILIEYHDPSEVGYGYLAPSIIASIVPEPASWAMMLAGMGLLGSSMRRSRSRAPARAV